MKFVFKIIKSKVTKIVAPEIRSLRFLIGQTAILSSRVNSKNFRNLWDAEVKVYSQWGEDGILDFLCEQIDLSKPKVLEIGAGNFSECNSRFLAENRNASVYAVDGRDDLVTSVAANSLKWKNHIFAQQIWVSPDNINQIISNAEDAIGPIDIFSLDLDGNDYWILEAANLDSVKIVVVEYNPLFGHKKAVTIPRKDNFDRRFEHNSCLYYGASLLAFKIHLSQKGFTFIGSNRVGNNAFFVRDSFAPRISLTPSADYSIYTDWRVRETRDKDGSLTYASGYARVTLIKELQLIDIESGNSVSVGEANPAD